jgi:hypothetical protein
MELVNRRHIASAAIALASVATVLLASPSAVIEDPGFSSGIEDWSDNAGDPGAISWNPALGDLEPGSLRIRHHEVAQGTLFEAATQCFAVEPESMQPVVTASVYAELASSNERCELILIQYLGEDCTGGRLFLGNTPQNLQESWERRASGGGSYLPGVLSAKIGLQLFRLPGAVGTSTCHFDDLALGTESVVDVSADRRSTQLLLGLTLALAGLWAVRSL